VATGYHEGRDYQELNGVKINQFRVQGNSVKGITGEVEQYRSFLQSALREYDLVLNYAAQIWTTDLMFDLLPSMHAATVLVPCGFSGLRRFPYSLMYRRYYANLPKYLELYDHVIYHSAGYQDKQYGDEHGVESWSVIPNAIDETEFDAPRARTGEQDSFRRRFGISEDYMVLCVSNHNVDKGHQFVIDAFKRLNRSDATLVVIGEPVTSRLKSCFDRCVRSAQRIPRVRMLSGVSREDVVRAYLESDLFVMGSKIECSPITILEAMASGTPFISTPVGCVGDYEDGIIVRTSQEMAERMNELLDDKARRDSIADSLRRQCLSYNVWSKVVLQYEALFERLVQEKRKASS